MRLTHTLPELAQCLGGSKEKFGREEVLDWPNWRSTEPLCWPHCYMFVKHGQSTSTMPGNCLHLNCLRKILRITWQDKVTEVELNCQVFKLCFKEHNSDGLATLFECKMYTCQKDYFVEHLHGAGDHMVARRNDTRTSSRSLSRTLDLTVQHERHWHRTAQHGVPT